MGILGAGATGERCGRAVRIHCRDPASIARRRVAFAALACGADQVAGAVVVVLVTDLTGEGGCVVTNDVEVLNRIRDARMLGVEKDSEKRFSGLRSWDFDVTRQGWRYHMSNIMAAIGIEQLKNFKNVARIRQKICKSYDTMFETHPQIWFGRNNATSNFFLQNQYFLTHPI